MLRMNLQRHEKCQFYAFGEGARGLDEAKYQMAPDATGKIISNENKCVFILTLVKSFSCQSFRQNYF